MNYFKKLWHGKYSLYKTFWIYGALILLILKLPDGIMKKMSPFALNQIITFIVAYTFIVGAYQLVVAVGIWKSSSNYKGKEIWAYSAKAYSIASLIFLFITTLNVFTIDGFYGFLYVLGLLLIAYLLDKPLGGNNALKEEKENFTVNPSKDLQESKKNTSEILIGSNNQSSKQSMEDAYSHWSDAKNNPATNLQKNTAISSDEAETDYWEIASDECEGENRKKGLWAKCFSEADGDENKAKAKYLKLRVIELKSGNKDETQVIQNQAKPTTISCPKCHTTNVRARDNCVTCNYNLRELTKVFGR